jgi:hypothetical protein
MTFSSRSTLSSLLIALALSSTSVAQTAGAATPPAPAPQTNAGPATGPAAKTPAPSTTTPAPKAAPAPAPARVEVTPASLYAMRAGLSVRELTDGEKKKLGRAGYLVDTVTADSPAAKAGITTDDIVTGIDGASPPTVRELVERIQGAEEGQLFKISIVRAGKDMVVDVQLAGETKEEREKREEEERQKKEEEEKEEDAAKEKLEQEREEAEKKAKEEAEKATKDGATEAGENVEAVVEEDDKFGMLGCCICSTLCPPAAPALAIAMFLVDASPTPERERGPTTPSTAHARVMVVRY